jgi:hypothetical protein
LLRTFAFSAAVADPASFLRFNFLDELLVIAEALPSIGGKVVLFLYILLGKNAFGVACKVADKIEVALKVCRLAM